MPIYEYEAVDPQTACTKCRRRFEAIQSLNEPPLTQCPSCGGKLRKVISWCRAAVIETSEEHAKVENQIAEYEREGMWSHAAELADKHSEKIKDKDLKLRALEDYEKAGYDAKSLESHAGSEDWSEN
ncbi:MAG: zinc ribbon domain-containing protein [Deltaproteobacteria bacterium]|nr:zinc ribbon domain-containing protein [Deltaproteobacteria bacterium]MBW2082445.1 zinc ribbon domain-containing protein [Deltaproteobacteria bacterium]